MNDLQGFGASVSFARPSNTTAYTALDVVGAADTVTPANAGSAILQFTNCVAPGRESFIHNAELVIGGATVISGMAGFRLHLYTSAPTAILDNAAFDLVLADRLRYLTYIVFETPVDIGSTIFARTTGILQQIKPETSDLFGILQTVGGFTPESGTTFGIRLHSQAI